MLKESSAKNIDKAKRGKLQVSFPFQSLNTNEAPLSAPTTGCHPCTGSNIYMSPFDRFHIRNCEKEIELLKLVEHIPELKGRCNTEDEEH